MRFCISYKLPDDANVADPQISFWWGQHSRGVLREQRWLHSPLELDNTASV